MTSSTAMGLALTILAGMMSGNCMLPTKFVRSWKWEHVWSVFSLVSLVILPWALALSLVGHLAEAYSSLSFYQFAVPVVFGAGWGVAQILFGISVRRLGLGIAYSIIVGLGAVLGTLVPLFAGQHNAFDRNQLVLLPSGVVLMVLGIALTAWSGHLREVSTGTKSSVLQGSRYVAAIAMAVLCGVMAPMLNYSFAFGQDIARHGVVVGNSPVLAAYAVWPIGLAGGFIPNAAYSIFLLARHRSWSGFRAPFPDIFWSSLMAALWMGAFALYGMSAVYFGALGTSIGWGLFQTFMIMAATLSGILTGEWREASGQARACLSTGLTLLVVATTLLTMSNRH
jgi:L-rhamnose-H+ transport protein